MGLAEIYKLEYSELDRIDGKLSEKESKTHAYKRDAVLLGFSAAQYEKNIVSNKGNLLLFDQSSVVQNEYSSYVYTTATAGAGAIKTEENDGNQAQQARFRKRHPKETTDRNVASKSRQ